MKLQRPLFIIPLLVIITHLLYYPTWNAGFVTDFTGLMERLEGQPMSGILTCFGFPALQQVLNAFLYLFYHLFDLHPLPWYLVHTSMHLLNAYLGYLLIHRILGRLNINRAHTIALLGVMMFLFSPYQSEVLTWRVCFNYLLSTALTLGSLLTFIQWLDNGQRRFYFLSLFLFISGIFTFELCLMIPFMCLCIYWLLPLKNRSIWRVSIPQFSVLGLYFLLNRWVIGSWVGHYGADTHLRFSLTDIAGNFYSYTAKLLGFVRYYRHRYKQPVFNWLHETEGVIIVSVILGIIFTICLWRYSNKSRKLKGLFLFILLFGIALIPVLNLFFNDVLHIENDRYNYLASIFFFPLLVLLWSYLPRWAFWSISAAYLLCSVYFLRMTNQMWAESTKIYNSLIYSFDEYDAPAVFLLNLPENYKGAPMFGDYSDDNLAFLHTLQYLRRQPYEGAMYDVSQYNMTRPTGGATATRVDSTNTLKVEFNQWGNWWWHRGNGMGPGYERPAYKVESHGHHYFFIPKDIPEGSVFLIQEGAAWKRKTFQEY
jgi:hypothetical protein